MLPMQEWLETMHYTMNGSLHNIHITCHGSHENDASPQTLAGLNGRLVSRLIYLPNPSVFKLPTVQKKFSC